MPTRKEVLMVVKEWVEKAEDDYRAAAHLLSMADGPIPYAIVCFHARQCVGTRKDCHESSPSFIAGGDDSLNMRCCHDTNARSHHR